MTTSTVLLLKSIAIVLLAFGIGYIVCVVASKERGLLRSSGYVIGMAIIVSSICIVLFRCSLVFHCDEAKKKVIVDDLGPKRLVDIPGPMSPPRK